MKTSPYFRVKGRNASIPKGWLVVVRVSYDEETGTHRFACVDSKGNFHTLHEEDVQIDGGYFEGWYA